MPITRNGRREDVYWTYSYGPIDDEAAPSGVGGVLVICAETTEHVLTAQRARAERERLSRMFEQAPGFMAMLEGPEHRSALANPAYMRLIGHRGVLGRTVAEALPSRRATSTSWTGSTPAGRRSPRPARGTPRRRCRAGRWTSASSTSCTSP